MDLKDVISEEWLDAEKLSKNYKFAKPYPHIVMENFIKKGLLESVANEFPDLSNQEQNVVKKYNNNREIKLASKGMKLLSPAALYLNSYLQSDLMLKYLNKLSGINETLISDPYLNGGGYHEIKSGGFLKIHADFNKHAELKLYRRLNMLIYLNKNWLDSWGGELELFDKSRNKSSKKIFPRFNTAVIFTTSDTTYHGHPYPLKCPENYSRRSIAYYYFSISEPKDETSSKYHSTIFVDDTKRKLNMKKILIDIIPPVITRIIKRVFFK